MINVQVHTVDVTEEVYNIINHGYAVVELWGHQGAVFDQANNDDDKEYVVLHIIVYGEHIISCYSLIRQK